MFRALALMLLGAAGLAGAIYGASRYEPTQRMLDRLISDYLGGAPAVSRTESTGAVDDAAADEGEPRDLPLRPSRRLDFTMDEGTWISLDVSPDGRTIMFELLGDVYTMPISGGEATPLLTGMAFDSQPVYSPNGEEIAFLSDRDGGENLWVADADGSNPRRLSAGGDNVMASPEWSADGDYVFVSKSTWSLGVFELWMHHKDGGRGVRLTRAGFGPGTPREARFNALGPAPSPDGRYLYFASKRGGFSYNMTFPQWSVSRHDLRTGERDTVITAYGSAMRPVISPDGSRLVYATRYDAETGLRLRDLETGEDRWLLYPVTRDDQESRSTRDLMPNAAFTPDGDSLITTLDGKIQRVDIETGEARVLPFTADVSLEIGPELASEQRIETGPVKARIIQSPAESPDGRRIAFSALGELYVHDVRSGETTRIEQAGTSAFQPSWSPNGRALAYVTWTSEGGQVWRINPDRGEPRRITETRAFYSDPVFTPDGREILALRAPHAAYLQKGVDFGPTPGSDLVRLPARGGAARLVTHASGLRAPHFAGEDDRVHVYSSAGLESFRLDGTDRRRHVQVQGPGLYAAEGPVPADEIRMRPGGGHVLASVGNQLWLAAAPVFDRSGAFVNVASPSVPVKRLSDMGADYFGWSADGESFFWAVGSTIYRQKLADVAFREPPQSDENGTPADDAPDERGESDDEGEEGDEGDEEEGPDEEENEDADDPLESDASRQEREAADERVARQADERGSGAGEDAADGMRADDLADWEPALREADDAVETIEIEIFVPRDTPSGAVLLSGATVITMNGEEIVADADLLVEGERIAAIGPRGGVDVPAGARVVDVAGKWIAPGFIDTHAHWFEIRRGVIEPDHWGFLANLAYGVTAGLDVQTSTNDMFAYQDMIDAGRMTGLRAFSTGPGVFSNNAFKSKDEAYGVLKRYRDHYRTRNIKAYISGNRRQRQFLMQAAKKLGMLPTTEGALEVKLNLTHAVDGFWGIEHALPNTPLYEDVVELLVRTNIAYTPTLLVSYGGPWAENFYFTRENPHNDEKLNFFTPPEVLHAKTQRRPWVREEEHVFPRLAADAAAILRAGGRVGVGGHGQLQGLGYHWELWSLAAGGLSPMEALQAATIGGARIIGYEDDIGSIEPGKFADLNVFSADPSADIRNSAALDMVMKNGRLYDADTLAEIAPDPAPAPDLWFRDAGPRRR